MNAGAPGRPLRFRLFLLAASGLLPLAHGRRRGARLPDRRARSATRSRRRWRCRARIGTGGGRRTARHVGVLQSLALSDELQPRAAARLPCAGRPHRQPRRAGAPWCWPTPQGRVLAEFGPALRRRPARAGRPGQHAARHRAAPAGGGPRGRGPAAARARPSPCACRCCATAQLQLRAVGRHARRQHPGGAAAPERCRPPRWWPCSTRTSHRVARSRAARQPTGPRPRCRRCSPSGAAEGVRPHRHAGRRAQPHRLQPAAPSGWVVATGISAAGRRHAASTACWARWAAACWPRSPWRPSWPGTSRATSPSRSTR